MSYSESLKGSEKKRYLRKLQCLHGLVEESAENDFGVQSLDPYELPPELWVDNVSLWPPVEFPHIYVYLIDTPGEFTREKLKAFKSLEAYNYYANGWVRTVFYHDLGTSNPNCLLKAKVTPSQRINDKPHEAWVAVGKKTCSVVTAHCTCMAGLGEVCSHVAAVLFKVKACVRLGMTAETCTSQPCLWNQAYSKKIEPAPVIDINFDRPRRLKENSSTSTTTCINPDPSDQMQPVVPSKILYDALYDAHPSAAVFTVIPGYFTPPEAPPSASLSEPKLPVSLTSLYNQKYSSCTTSQIVRLSRMKVVEITCSEQEAEFLEQSTKNQCSSTLWYDHRIGCITASFMGAISKCTETTYPTSLVKSIMQYNIPSMHLPALKWGRLNEEKARQQYQALMSTKHTNFSVKQCGLHINPQYPFLGATPDGTISCSCCGNGLLEIKCPLINKMYSV